MKFRFVFLGLLATLTLQACGYPADWDQAKRTCQVFQDKAGARTSFYEFNRAIDDASTPKLPIQPWPKELSMTKDDFVRLEKELNQVPTLGSLILSHGDKVVYEKYFNGVRPTLSQNVHSLSKSILSMVVGVLLKKGSLESVDVKLSSVLPDSYKGLLKGDKASLTVADMLQMSSGLKWVEDSTEYRIEKQSKDWIQEILSLPHNPQKKFNYSTGNSHVLSAMVKHLTGSSLCEYTHRHLLLPLGIEAEHWGVDPQAYSSGGFEVNLTAREIALLGHVLVNDDPKSGYTQFFSKGWLQQSTSRKAQDNNIFSYAYHWWVPTQNNIDVFFAWGYGGQFLFVMPSQNLSIVVTGNTSKDQDYGEFIVKAVLGALQVWFSR